MAITRVNFQVGGPGSGASVATSAGSHTATNTVIAVVSWEGSGTLTSVTDTAGNTYTKKTERRQTAADAVQVAYAFNITGNAANVVTANFSGTIDFSSIRALQYSGLTTTDPFDVEAGGNGSSTAATSGSVSTNQADELLINAAVNFGGGVTWSPTSPWVTEVTETSNCATDERIVSATASYSAAQTPSSTTDWAIAFAAFKAAVAAGVVSPRPQTRPFPFAPGSSGMSGRL
jgi:macrolide-specific efflux system membrane fusion protein